MNTVDPQEVEKFSQMADEWWDPRGKFKPLHDINPLRIEYIRDRCIQHFGRKSGSHTPLEGLTLLDIGCGGGLITEPMHRLGADVTGVDASERNIGVAGLHAEEQGMTLDYRCTTAESLLEEDRRFDIVLALEIIEHVADTSLFAKSCLELLKPDGLLIMSTLNRTLKSYLFAIVGAEYVLRILPKGTHEWDKFLRPSELTALVREHGGNVTDYTGLTVSPSSMTWKLGRDLSVNYMITVEK